MESWYDKHKKVLESQENESNFIKSISEKDSSLFKSVKDIQEFTMFYCLL